MSEEEIRKIALEFFKDKFGVIYNKQKALEKNQVKGAKNRNEIIGKINELKESLNEVAQSRIGWEENIEKVLRDVMKKCKYCYDFEKLDSPKKTEKKEFKGKFYYGYYNIEDSEGEKEKDYEYEESCDECGFNQKDSDEREQVNINKLIEEIEADFDELIAWANNYPKDSEIYIRLKRKREKWQGRGK